MDKSQTLLEMDRPFDLKVFIFATVRVESQHHPFFKSNFVVRKVQEGPEGRENKTGMLGVPRGSCVFTKVGVDSRHHWPSLVSGV